MQSAAINTSVVWSALAYPDGPSGPVIDRWYAGVYDLVWTEETLAEYRAVLLKPEYIARFDYAAEVEEFITLVGLCGHEAKPAQGDLPPIRDDHDRIWIAAAVGGKADYLVTSDDDFLGEPPLIREMRNLGIRIVTPLIFVREVDRS